MYTKNMRLSLYLGKKNQYLIMYGMFSELLPILSVGAPLNTTLFFNECQ